MRCMKCYQLLRYETRKIKMWDGEIKQQCIVTCGCPKTANSGEAYGLGNSIEEARTAAEQTFKEYC